MTAVTHAHEGTGAANARIGCDLNWYMVLRIAPETVSFTRCSHVRAPGSRMRQGWLGLEPSSGAVSGAQRAHVGTRDGGGGACWGGDCSRTGSAEDSCCTLLRRRTRPLATEPRVVRSQAAAPARLHRASCSPRQRTGRQVQPDTAHTHTYNGGDSRRMASARCCGAAVRVSTARW